jgi:hypothetical protein
MTEPVSNQTVAPRTGFRAFVERHDALFTVVGALIVFLGFYVREGVQEKNKEIIADLSRYEAKLDLDRRLSELAVGLRPLKKALAPCSDLPLHPMAISRKQWYRVVMKMRPHLSTTYIT